MVLVVSANNTGSWAVRTLQDVIDRLGALADRDAPFGSRTTYRVGGTARAFVSIANASDLSTLAEALQGSEAPVVVLGRGSNMLVSDSGFEGIVLLLQSDGDFGQVKFDADADCIAVAGAAVGLPNMARLTAEKGFAGFEWAVGVPGSIGGAIRTNAGCHNSSISSSIVDARVLDLRTGIDRVWSREELGLAYRNSALEDHQLVLEARLQLERSSPDECQKKVAEYAKWRQANHPTLRNAGSVFKNPSAQPAGKLIDDCGLKGHRYGSAAVSVKHANFIIADKDGRADDVNALINLVMEIVGKETQVSIEPEITLVGYDD